MSPRKEAPMHHQNTIARFWEKVDHRGPVPAHAPIMGCCWLWVASISPQGYGHFSVTDGARRRVVPAHRFAFEISGGAIPAHHEIDHLCRTRACVNPGHLQAVTGVVNIRRGQRASMFACLRGHLFTPANTRIYTYRNGNVRRHCRQCQQLYEERRAGRESAPTC